MKTNKDISRRRFIQASSALLALFAMDSKAIANLAAKPKLAFSTLGCPDWDFDKIIRFGSQYGYNGVEFRGIQREMDLTKSALFNNAKARSVTSQKMKENALGFAGFDSSTRLHIKAKQEREKHLDEAKRFIDLAAQMECPFVRVFPNNFPKEQDKSETKELIVAGLELLGGHAKGTGVKVLMETHGDVVYTKDVLDIIKATSSPQIDLVWDVANMWLVTGESPDEVYQSLGNRIAHVHLKDALKRGKEIEHKPLGEGEVPINKAFQSLKKNGYSGYLCFEWEKYWFPQIAEPEEVFAKYPIYMKKNYFKTGK